MTAKPHRATHILIVDDEPLIVQLMADMLEDEGYEVDTAANGAQALERIKARTYDLILSDLRMPGLDGLALYRELAWQRPELLRRMIFVSGAVEHQDYREFLEETHVPLLPKPFKLEELRRLAEQVLSPS